MAVSLVLALIGVALLFFGITFLTMARGSNGNEVAMAAGTVLLVLAAVQALRTLTRRRGTPE